MKNRFIAFAYGNYYPYGGAQDIVSFADSFDAAKAGLIEYIGRAKQKNRDVNEAHILDVQTMKGRAWLVWEYELTDEEEFDYAPKEIE